ncbi:hypothetical protein BC940DRAFT_246971 [Gongronella butleri]|nr:hypothetical protein BC940DRAFT_246971 [Gongronella butleri]
MTASLRRSTSVRLRPVASGSRRVYFNLELAPQDCKSGGKGGPKQSFVTNRIRTSKYTWYTFVPKNLFEQFRRAANMYFLIMAIIQLLPMFGVKSPVLTLLPICAVVFISAVKDGFEDYQRHKVDARYNSTPTRRLHGYTNPNDHDAKTTKKKHKNDENDENDDNARTGKFATVLSKDVRVGDLLLLRNGESCPADCILLASADSEHGICFVETKDLDGETNLKPRTAVASTMHAQNGDDCLDQHFYIESPAPTPDLYSYQGTMVMTNDTNSWKELSKLPLSIDNLLLRGHVVRNTPWAIAIVVFTGTDTKIMLNSGETPSKRSQVDKNMNSEIFIAFAVLILLCLVCAIMAGVIKQQNDGMSGSSLFTQRSESPTYFGFLNFWSSLIIFQNIIPISLYVSIEFVKTFQWHLSDDLGQIEYMFSDKTGTLTRNMMEFRECSINGQRYGNNNFAPETEAARGARIRDQQDQQQGTDPEKPHVDHDDELGDNSHDNGQAARLAVLDEYKEAMKQLFQPKYASTDERHLSFADPQLMKDLQDDQTDHGHALHDFFTLLALCHTCVVERLDKQGNTVQSELEDDDDVRHLEREMTEIDQQQQQQQPQSSQHTSSTLSTGGGKRKHRWRRGKPSRRHSTSSRPEVQEDKDSDVEKRLAEERLKRVDPTVDEQLEYKAESPDEAALVQTAKNVGFAYLGRGAHNKEMLVDILGTQYAFELLHVFEFNSTRKRMSVIVKRPAPWNDTVLYCKGADNIMFSRLDASSPLNQARMQQTQHDIDEYSRNGLRTLVLGYRVLDSDSNARNAFRDWQARMHEATTALEDRTQKMDVLHDELEQHLTLLGATAIEDKLQDGVPECIDDLRHAGIKIWVLTGDKLETAINIGYSCNLLDTSLEILVVRGGGEGASIASQFASAMKKQQAAAEDAHFGLVIDGAALTEVFDDGNDELKLQLVDIAVQCKSVVCCRVSPLQKALVVELIRTHKKVVTLAVGDGANDVSMIQAANVGVGIAGQEGVQASMAADYAIAQFRFLRKLLLVQGHWNYERISEMILNFFFKNVFWVFPSLWFQIYSQFSGNIFYDYSFLQLYNLLFTVAPTLYTKWRFWIYFFDGVWMSVVVFYAFFFSYQVNPNPQGLPESGLQMSTSVAVTAVVLANMMPGFNTYYWTWFQWVFVILEIAIIFLWVVIYGAFINTTMYGMAFKVFGTWNFWLTFFVAIVVSFLPRYAVTFVIQWWFPDVMHQVRHIEFSSKRRKH